LFHISRPKRTYLARSTLVWTALLILSPLGLSSSARATSNVRDTMVKIYQSNTAPTTTTRGTGMAPKPQVAGMHHLRTPHLNQRPRGQ
jgi:hypothetical protein